MSKDILEKIDELESLYICYKALAESGLEKTVSNFGTLAIYERMRDVLSNEDIFPVISQNVQYPLEDYIYHVIEDTPDFICTLRNSSQSIN